MRKDRKLRNYLVDPRIQVKFALWSVLISTVFGSAAMLMTQHSIHEIIEVLIDETTLTTENLSLVGDLVREHLVALATVLGVLLVANGLFFIVLLHRIAGAKTAILNFLKSAQILPFDPDPVVLRKADHLKDVADELNSLYEFLQKK